MVQVQLSKHVLLWTLQVVGLPPGNMSWTIHVTQITQIRNIYALRDLDH